MPYTITAEQDDTVALKTKATTAAGALSVASGWPERRVPGVVITDDEGRSFSLDEFRKQAKPDPDRT
jgi:hypothetical protein